MARESKKEDEKEPTKEQTEPLVKKGAGVAGSWLSDWSFRGITKWSEEAHPQAMEGRHGRSAAAKVYDWLVELPCRPTCPVKRQACREKHREQQGPPVSSSLSKVSATRASSASSVACLPDRQETLEITKASNRKNRKKKRTKKKKKRRMERKKRTIEQLVYGRRKRYQGQHANNTRRSSRDSYCCQVRREK